MDYLYWAVAGFLLFVFLNVVDFLLTRRILLYGGREFNPIMRLIYSRFGVIGMVALKVLMLCFFGSQLISTTLDLYTIWYLNFLFTVVLVLMFFDIRKFEQAQSFARKT